MSKCKKLLPNVIFDKKNGGYIKEIDKQAAFDFITTYHYSKQLPRLTKHCLGYYTTEGELVGALTLGWGTRPKHTIQKIWSQLESKDYFEIGKMALDDKMPRNSESQFLSLVVQYIKKYLPNVKVLFTWADGMLGKPGYVYQAANFYYAGFYLTDTYFTQEGERVHPRTAQSFKQKGKSDEEKASTPKKQRPTQEQLDSWGWSHVKGKQFKYAFFTCDKREKKKLLKTSKVPLSRDYPKHKDLLWKIKVSKGKWEETERPYFNKESLGVYKSDKVKAIDLVQKTNKI